MVLAVPSKQTAIEDQEYIPAGMIISQSDLPPMEILQDEFRGGFVKFDAGAHVLDDQNNAEDDLNRQADPV